VYFPNLTTLRIIGQSVNGANTQSKQDEIQWPALDKLTPGNLKRTVSNIMKEWEKSLTPPPEERQDPISKTPILVDGARSVPKSKVLAENGGTRVEALRI